MKYIFLIIVAFLLIQEIPAQVRLSTMDSVTTFTPTDLFWLNTKPSSTFLNRKVSWRSLRSNIEDFMADSTHTWALRQTFSSGATFSSGSNGAVNFADSVNMVSATKILMNYIDRTVAASRIGTTAEPYLAVYSRNFVIPNTEGNDSVYISYDDSTLTFDKNISMPNLTITETVGIDSGASMNTFIYTPHSYTVPNVGDTVMTLTSTNKYSFIILDLPGNMTTGVSKLDVDGASQGLVVRFVNNDVSYSMKFNDYIGNDDNLYLSADFTMGQLDYIELMCIDDAPDSQQWVETSRSNN